MSLVTADPEGREILAVGKYGARYILRESLTVEGVMRRTKEAEFADSWLCRHGRHRHVVIGDVWVGPVNPMDDLASMQVGMLWGGRMNGLVQCERCGALAEERRPS